MTAAASGPVFSLRDIPFSHRGSWFGFSPVVAQHTYAEDVHLVSHQTGMHPILKLTPTAPAAITATPHRLTWAGEHGRIELAYESTDTVRVRGRGLGLRLLAADPVLTPFSGPYLYQDPVDGSSVFTVYQTGRRYRVTLLSGQAEQLGTQALATAERGLVLDGDWELAIEEYETARAPYTGTGPFEQVVKAARADFDAFVAAVAPWRTDRTPAAELAAYVLWSATVRPAGFVTRPAVLMSKHWMDKVWSWDHCFNALALADGLPELAWDQYRLPFDHQDAAGALPDSVTHSEILYNFVKPPIHGWALGRLPAGPDAYEPLARWTTFWLEARRAPGRELPHYQHGNDSGWDNATTFDPERVVETADLAAFLVLQLRELARLAPDAGWGEQADRMRDALLAELWDGERFVARGALTGRTWGSSSLLDLMPIVLGEELPAPVRAALAARIERHLTAFGLATELPGSPHYQDDGYWRGPIWAPSTVLIEDGLRRAGYPALADEISARFRALCEKSGFAENFDAQTGEGLRDRAYTWTASAYLILAAAHERRAAVSGPTAATSG
ncbi:Trehalase [[Actinomadura] parvosata subsp. kistnae]|uniref:Glycogen debranching protein n=1 Tax=[Actinomadura] parvosata subsp. kistnae TaxID=1909395 RepID=A0A1V0A0F2_9ACTN|nr:glycogen debranching protein [Nonomuraea sp. ATCC 55076]AQZ63673.1 glycogen debranching protein [Nonomuraea sp. ATCC 55076]SPL99470.1 Trehalase [Actinomadura parvosata subsp. kistnae]